MHPHLTTTGFSRGSVNTPKRICLPERESDPSIAAEAIATQDHAPRITPSTPKLVLRPARRLAFAGRVSDEDEEDKSYGLEIQEDDVRKFAHAYDWDLIIDDRWRGYESGRIPLQMRQIAQNILADARAGKFDAVCFGRINRIARKFYYGAQLVEELEAAGVQVFTADLQVDTNEPAGQYVRNIMLATAEFDCSSLLKNMAAGRAKRLNRGKAEPGKPWISKRHYGYRYTRPSYAEGIIGGITKHDEEAAIIVRMFERRAQRVSCERIAMELTADGIPSPGGHKVWSAATVRYILNNPAYLGTGKWGRRVSQRSARGKRSARARREGEPLDDMEFPRIITQEQWDAAHAATRCVVASRASKAEYLLERGMVHCAEHGRTMTGTLAGNGRPRYRCTQHITSESPRRFHHSVPGDTLEEQLWRELLAFLADPERGRQGVAEMIAERDRAVAEMGAELARLQKHEAELQDQARAALDLGLTGRLARQLLEAKVMEIEGKLDDVGAQIRRVEARLALANVAIPATEEVAEVCRQLSKGAYYADAAGKRALLEDLQVQVWVRGEQWWADGIVPGLHLEGTIRRSQWVQEENAECCATSIMPSSPSPISTWQPVTMSSSSGSL